MVEAWIRTLEKYRKTNDVIGPKWTFRNLSGSSIESHEEQMKSWELTDNNHHLTVINAEEYKRYTLYDHEHSNVSMKRASNLTSYNACVYGSRFVTIVNVLKDLIFIVICYYKGFNFR